MKMKEAKAWASQYEDVILWLSKLQNKTQNAFDLYRYCNWAKLNPTQLLALKKDPESKEAEKFLDRFVAASTPKLTNSVKFRIVSAVKSFYSHNYLDLAKKSGAITLEKKRPYRKPTKESLRKLWGWCNNPRDRCLITFFCSTAIAKETIVNLQWKHLEDNWQEQETPHISIEPKLIKGHGQGRYKGVRQETFLTPEAKKDLMRYKEWMERKLGREFKKDDYIFLSTYKPYNKLSYRRLGVIIYNLSKESGVPFSPHDARRFVETALEEAGFHSNWARRIRGRKVAGSENPYSRPEIETLREKYREALQYLEFVTPPSPERVRLEEQKKAAIRMLESAGIDYRVLLRSKKAKTLEGEVEVLQKKIGEMLKVKTQPNPEIKDEANCANGGNCQRIVSEGDLPDLLNEGWCFVATLPSGKILISNE